MWIGTRAHGLYRYRNGQLSHYHHGQRTGQRQHLLHSRGQARPFLVQWSFGRDAAGPWRSWNAQGPEQRKLLSCESSAPTRRQARAVLWRIPSRRGPPKTAKRVFPTSQGLWSIRPVNWNIHSSPPEYRHHDGRWPARVSGWKLDLDAGSDRVEIAYEPVLLAFAGKDCAFATSLTGMTGTGPMRARQQRLATYTNLPAGSIHVLVEALGDDHPGHTAAPRSTSSKKPYFYRRHGLWPSALVLVGLVSILAYQVRMKQIHGRFKAVLAERTRLAREMHDTLIKALSISALLEAASSGEVDDNESTHFDRPMPPHRFAPTVDEARQAVWNLRGRRAHARRSGGRAPGAWPNGFWAGT